MSLYPWTLILPPMEPESLHFFILPHWFLKHAYTPVV